MFLPIGVFAQKAQRLESNGTFSVHSAFGNTYQSFGCSVPLVQSNWELYAQRNFGITEMAQVDNPSNFFIGGLTKIQLHPKWSFRLGAGIISKLELAYFIFPLQLKPIIKYYLGFL